MAEQLARQEGRTEQEIEDIVIAAWFHDSGFSVNFFGHEYYSARVAVEALERLKFDSDRIKKISNIILATNFHIDSSTPDEELIKDADLHYLAGDQYFALSDLLREEWLNIEGRVLTDLEWYRGSLHFFEDHKWQTAWAKENWQDGKEQNKLEIQRRLSQLK
jgi:predicted metal-dependent HD superfamily phosphohydrolase